MFRNINILNGKVQLNPILIGGMGMMKYMQRLGKSLMLPVSVMPIAALLKVIGSTQQDGEVIMLLLLF